MVAGRERLMNRVGATFTCIASSERCTCTSEEAMSSDVAVFLASGLARAVWPIMTGIGGVAMSSGALFLWLVRGGDGGAVE